MGKPLKKNADYFPLYASGKKMRLIRSTYGNNGFAVWITLLQELTNAEDHFIKLSPINRKMLAVECCVKEELLIEIIEAIVELGGFDLEIYNKGYLFCEKLRESLVDAYRKRRNNIIERSQILLKIDGNSVGVNLKESIKIPKKNPELIANEIDAYFKETNTLQDFINLARFDKDKISIRDELLKFSHWYYENKNSEERVEKKVNDFKMWLIRAKKYA